MQEKIRHIRFGVIATGTHLFAWQADVIRKLTSETGIDLQLRLIENKGSDTTDKASSSDEASSTSSYLWNLYYGHLIKKRCKALQKVDSGTLFEGVSQVYFEPRTNTNGFTVLADHTLAEIENHQLDFILNFSFFRFAGEVSRAASFGIWTYQNGDPKKYKANTRLFWEIYHADIVTAASLVRTTTDADTTIMLKQGVLKTAVSYHKNIDHIYSQAVTWPLMVCHDIKTNRLLNSNTSTEGERTENFMPPSSWQLLNFFLIQFTSMIKSMYKQLFFTDYWNIGIARTPIHEFLNVEKEPEVLWFPDLPKKEFMADPFGIYIGDELHILYENLHFDEGIGKIATFTFNKSSFGKKEIVIDEEFHMSYPFLFEHEGDVYCIPESYQAGQVRLYKAVDFPDKWHFEKVLIDGYQGIDNTLYKHQDKWYMFSTDKNSGPHYNLNIHYSDNILGRWRPHPKNPVKTDIRSARPAGTIFKHNDQIFRPSMDYSEKIEGRIVINKIVTLSINEYTEEMHTIINPIKNTPFSDKIHTLSQVGPYTLVDGAKELFVFHTISALKYKFRRALQKLRT